MTTVPNGLLGGLLVGIVAALGARLVRNDPSAPGVIVNRLFESSRSRWVQLAGQLLYGALAGGGLIALELYVLQLLSVPPDLGVALAVALAWSLLLFILWALIWRIVSVLPWDRFYLGELLVYHLIYGLGFGLWIRMTWIT